MNLTELKQKPIAELLEMSDAMGLENMARSRKQDIIFALLKKHAKSGEEISGDGVLEILQDGFGFLRSADSSYLAGPDDIYVSPSQIRRDHLARTAPLGPVVHQHRAVGLQHVLLEAGISNVDDMFAHEISP